MASEAKSEVIKPGWKTTEFWQSALVVVVGLLIASGAVPEESGFGKIIAMVASALASLGYSFARGTAKKG